MRVTRQIILLAGPVMLLFLTSCRTPQAQSFSQLKIGMSKEDVTKLLGSPSSKWTPAPTEGDEDADPLWSSRWQYGDCLSSAASTAISPDIAPDRVWVVKFDHDDRVMEFRPPIKPSQDPAQMPHTPIQSRYDTPAGMPPK